MGRWRIIRRRILTDTDFNDDGLCDCDDVDALVNRIATGAYSAAFDLNNDGVLDTNDLDLWLNDAALKNGLPSAYLPGDATLDGFVDTSDFNQWNNNKFTALAGWCGGDFDANGFTEVSDFNIWNTFKFTSSFPRPAITAPGPLGHEFAGTRDIPDVALSIDRGPASEPVRTVQPAELERLLARDRLRLAQVVGEDSAVEDRASWEVAIDRWFALA